MRRLLAPVAVVALLSGCPFGPGPGDDSGGDPDVDADDDGFTAAEDCDDADDTTFPGAPERCDGVDNDCDDALAPGEADDDDDGEPDCTRCDRAGYWDETHQLDDPDLLADALKSQMTGLSCTYVAATDQMFLRIDNHGGWVECVYTGRETPVTSDKPDPVTDMNTEHSWPQSQGASSPPEQCDLHHLYPADVDANDARGNHPFGEVVSAVTWSEGGSRLGRDSSGSTVFEPRDAHKGDVARSMLYFSLRYGASLSSSQADLFLEWHAADPVSDAEWQRTRAIEDFQAYSNPFVACPDLAERVMGR